MMIRKWNLAGTVLALTVSGLGLAALYFLPSQATSSKPEADIRSLVITQIRNSAELATTIYIAEVVVPVKQDRKMFGRAIASSDVLYVAHGQVKAGVDLGALQPEDVQVTEQGVIVQLPAAQILDSKIDVAKSQAYSSDKGFLNLGPDTAQLQTVAEREALARVVQAACSGGILEQASDRAVVVVEKLLSDAGSSVTVEVQKSNKCGG